MGDLDVDQHHTVEDVGIALGEVFDRALGDRRGILRAGYFVMPMDETLGLAAVDFGGRAAAALFLPFPMRGRQKQKTRCAVCVSGLDFL